MNAKAEKHNGTQELMNAKDYVREQSGAFAVGERRREPRRVPERYQFNAVSVDVADFEEHGEIRESDRRYAIVLDESDGGCSLVVQRPEDENGEPVKGYLKVHSRVVLQRGTDAPRIAVVRWRMLLSDKLINAGFEYAE